MMNNLLKKLDATFGRWIDNMDGQLQAPINHAMSGEVFVHGVDQRPQYEQIIVEQDAPAHPSNISGGDRAQAPITAECDRLNAPRLRPSDKPQTA
ncbi:MAG: hypothetical protein RLP44_00415 [Aggregatilineales bacterium]